MKNTIVGLFIVIGFMSYSQKGPNEILVEENQLESYEEIIQVSLEDVKTGIVEGFKTGNVKIIASYFSANLDINILGKENLYSKPQAEQVLKTFFNENKPVSFVLLHEGKSNKTKYFVGILETLEKKFRVSINTKLVSGKDEIFQINIEKED